MKMLMIVYNISLSNEVISLLDSLKVTCFTQWPRVIGRGQSTGPKYDNDVWPGANAAIMVVADEAKTDELFKAIAHLRDEIGTHEGVKAFQLAVERMTGDI